MDAHILETIDMSTLGRALQRARTNCGMTQEDAARVIDVARTTITSIEKGERRLKPGELIKLARAYGQPVGDFVRSRPEIPPFAVQFRGPHVTKESDQARIQTWIDTLENYCRDYLELEELLKAPMVRKYPPEYQMGGLPLEQAAESIALQERARLGLGDGPLPLLRDIFEQDVGLRIFYLPLQPSTFSAVYHFDEKLGGCIALNSLHPEERRRWSLSHDYAHFLTNRYRPTAHNDAAYQRKPETEQFADLFALYFLMPTSGLMRRFADIKRAHQQITVSDLCIQAYHYGVSVEALVNHLEDLKIIKVGTWDGLKTQGFKVRDAQKMLQLGNLPSRDDVFPLRYQYLALDAFEQERISEGQLTQFLHVDRLEARRLIAVLQEQRDDASEPSKSLLDTGVDSQEDVHDG